MAATTAAMMVASTVLSAASSISQGQAQNAAAKSEARDAKSVAAYQGAQLRQQAGQERATAQRSAIEQRRRGALAQSRARAVAGASGAGVDDPTVVNILGDLAGEGEYNALADLYSGEESALGLEQQAAAGIAEGDAMASAARYRGRAARRAGYIDAAGTVLSSGSSFYDKYGDDFFKTAAA